MAGVSVLKEEFREIRDRRASGVASNSAQAVSFERYFRAAAADDKPLDALRRYATDEAERFWSYAISGLDEHVYWDGPENFRTNDGRHRRPVRWVWENKHKTSLPTTTDVWTTCGEKNCISPEHLAAGRSEKRLRFRDEAILGAAQVAAMRLGHPPTTRWWAENHMKPTLRVIGGRWGAWAKFLIAAGLDPGDIPVPLHASDELCCEALRALAKRVGRVPSATDWDANREWLHAHDFPASRGTISRHLGQWEIALRKAGLR